MKRFSIVAGLAGLIVIMSVAVMLAFNMSMALPAEAGAQPGRIYAAPLISPTAAPTCAPSWASVVTPNVGTLGSLLSGVDGVSANDMWAVGYYQEEGNTRRKRTPVQKGALLSEEGKEDAPGAPNARVMRTLIEHWDGTQWSLVPSPNITPYDSVLASVDALSANDVWAAGYYVNSFGVAQTLALHWNGQAWSVVPSPNVGPLFDNELTSIEAVSATDVWAVGYYYNDLGTAQTLTMRWNGTQWTIVPSPNFGEHDNYIYDMTVVSANEAWAVGVFINRTGTSSVARSLTMRWNGAQWNIVPSPGIGSRSNVLYSVDAVSATDVWAVGYFYSVSGYTGRVLTQHWDGQTWNVVPTPELVNGGSLFAVDARTGDDVWAVGSLSGSSGQPPQTLALRWNGSAWSRVRITPTGTYPTAYNILSAVKALTEEDVWGVGSVSGSGNPRQVAIHYSTACVSCATRFSDVPEGSPFFEAIQCLVCQDIVGGYVPIPSPVSTAQPFPTPGPPPVPYFLPNGTITRGQLAKIVSSSAFLENEPGNQIFQDVPSYGNAYYLWINRLARKGIMSGYPCGSRPGEQCYAPGNLPYFRPNANATRGQIAKIVSNAANYAEPHTEQTFTDVPTSHPFYIWIARLSGRGSIGGYSCGGIGEPCDAINRPYFRWGNSATRGQVSKIAAKTFFPNCYTP